MSHGVEIHRKNLHRAQSDHQKSIAPTNIYLHLFMTYKMHCEIEFNEQNLSDMYMQNENSGLEAVSSNYSTCTVQVDVRSNLRFQFFTCVAKVLYRKY